MINNNHYPSKDDIKDFAIGIAARKGLYARRSDCHIQEIGPQQVHIPEIGGSNTPIRLPITQWCVTIFLKNRTLPIYVEYNQELTELDFID